jgi:type IV pilus assembly protein PilA
VSSSEEDESGAEPEPDLQPAQPPGWYPDPYNPLNQRYWDGSAWTAASIPKKSSLSRTYDEARHRKRIRLLVILGIVSVLLAAMAIVSLQVVARPILLKQEATAADTQAKADVTTLGRDIATYFLDNNGAPPHIAVVDGEYHIAGAPPPFDVEVVGPGVEFGGVTGTGPTDWCVWVTHPDGEYQDFRYSAVGGLEQGRC